jgi:excisionase family DNA binding protein
MTLREVAKYLNVHPATIRRLIRRDGLPFFRLGVDYRFKRENIDQWMAEKERSRRQRD